MKAASETYARRTMAEFDVAVVYLLCILLLPKPPPSERLEGSQRMESRERYLDWLRFVEKGPDSRKESYCCQPSALDHSKVKEISYLVWDTVATP